MPESLRKPTLDKDLDKLTTMELAAERVSEQAGHAVTVRKDNDMPFISLVSFMLGCLRQV